MPTTVFSTTFTGENSDGESSYRNKIPVSAASQGQVRVKFTSGTGGEWYTARCAIGVYVAGATPNDNNTVATPVELTFTGVNSGVGGHGYLLPANTSITSDWVNLSWLISDALVVIMDQGDDGVSHNGGSSKTRFDGDVVGSSFAFYQSANTATEATTIEGVDNFDDGRVGGFDLVETQASGDGSANLSAAQTIPVFTQAATIRNDAPLLITAAQTIPAFTQSARIEFSFGDILGTLVGGAASITNPTDATGSALVSIGDLVVAVIGQQTALTATAVTDNLGNTYSAQNAGTDAGNVTGRMFYSRVTAPGVLTAAHFAASASANDVSVSVAAFKGPFVVSPIDANPSNGTTDLTTPYLCPATGTLAQADELVVCWFAKAANAAWTASAPNLLAVQQNQSANVVSGIGYQVVAATTTVSPAFTGTAATVEVLGTASFMKDSAVAVRAITAAQAIPVFTQAFNGGVLDQIVVAQAVPVFTQTVNLGALDKITAAETIPNFTQASTMVVLGGVLLMNAAQTIPAFGQASTAQAIDKITVTEAVPVFAQASAVTSSMRVTAAQMVPAFTQVFTGLGADGQLIPAFAQSFAVKVRVTATHAQTVAAFTQTFNALLEELLSGIHADQVMPAFTQSVNLKAVDMLTEAHQIDPFPQTATVKTIVKITAAQSIDVFRQNARIGPPPVNTGNDSGYLQLRIGIPLAA